MKYLISILSCLWSVLAFAAPGDMEYLVCREYENAKTWNEKVFSLIRRQVEPEDYIEFSKEPRLEYSEKIRAQYPAISGSVRPLEYTLFHRKPSPYKSAIRFDAPFYYKDLVTLDYFLKLEFVGILCHPENAITEEERYDLLRALWAEIHRAQREIKCSYDTTRVRKPDEAERLKIARFRAMKKLDSTKASDARRVTLRCIADICGNKPWEFFDFLESSGLSNMIFSSKNPKAFLSLLLEANRFPARASDTAILHYFDENQARLHETAYTNRQNEKLNSKIPDGTNSDFGISLDGTLKTKLWNEPEACIDASQLKPRPKSPKRAFISGPGGRFDTPFDAPLLPGKISEKTQRMSQLLSVPARSSNMSITDASVAPPDEHLFAELLGWRLPEDDFLRKEYPRAHLATLDISGKSRLAERFFRSVLQNPTEIIGQTHFEKGLLLWNDMLSELQDCDLTTLAEELNALKKKVYEDPERSLQMEIQKKNLPYDREKMLAHEQARFFYLRQGALKAKFTREHIDVFLACLEHLYGNDIEAQLHACSRAGIRGKIDLTKYRRPTLSDEAILQYEQRHK